MAGGTFADERFDPLRHQLEIGFKRLCSKLSGIAGQRFWLQGFGDNWLGDWHLHGGLPVP